MGSLHNIDFVVFWASWGGSGKDSGEPVPGSVSGTGSGNPDSGPEALFRVQEVILLCNASILCLYFATMLVINVYFINANLLAVGDATYAYLIIYNHHIFRL